MLLRSRMGRFGIIPIVLSGCSTVETTVDTPAPPPIVTEALSDAADSPYRGRVGSGSTSPARSGPTSPTRSSVGSAAGVRTAAAVDPGIVRAADLPPREGASDPIGDLDIASEPLPAGDSAAGPSSPSAGGGGGGEDGAGTTPTGGYAVSGNPAAVNIVTGTGRLGELLGINRNGSGFGGLNISDANGILGGGLGPGKWTGDNLTISDLSIDLEEFAGWKGGLFGTQFLYLTSAGPATRSPAVAQGQNNPNALAGTVMGFNSLVAAPPFSRSELTSSGIARRSSTTSSSSASASRSRRTTSITSSAPCRCSDQAREHRVDLEPLVHAPLTSIRRCWGSSPAITIRPPASSPR